MKFSEIWHHLGEEKNQKRLQLIGGFFAALIAAGWVLYTHNEDKKSPTEENKAEKTSQLTKGSIGGYIYLNNKTVTGAQVKAYGQQEIKTDNNGHFLYQGIMADKAVSVEVEYDNNQYYASDKIQLNVTDKKIDLIKRK